MSGRLGFELSPNPDIHNTQAEEKSMKTIAFIGIGVMGKSMARNLMKHGYDVSVYTRTKEKAADIVVEGAK